MKPVLNNNINKKANIFAKQSKTAVQFKIQSADPSVWAHFLFFTFSSFQTISDKRLNSQIIVRNSTNTVV